MADNNKNPRRTIWLSETEPLSHYDIWLSKNKHLNADGEPVSDNGVLRDCDYIFKVWDCDNWHPIVGLNSTAVNKIDTVLNTSYTDSNNESHTSYSEFHVPLFTKPECSPSELFDGGTVGDVILKYVSNSEWELIIKHIYEETTIENPYTLLPASSSNLGGIKANTLDSFESGVAYGCIEERDSRHRYHIALTGADIYAAISEYLNSVDPSDPDSPDSPNDFHLWLASESRTGGIRAKTFEPSVQKFVEVGFKNTTDKTLPDYGRLFVKSTDVTSDGIELASDTKIGGIKAHLSDANVEDLIEVKLVSNSDPNDENYGFLYVNPIEITEDSFNDSEFISELLWLAFLNSPSIKKDWTYPYDPTSTYEAQKPRFSLYGTNDLRNNGGKFLRLRTEDEMQAMLTFIPPHGEEPYNETYNRLLWADISEYLGISGGTAIEIEEGKVNLRYNQNSFTVTNPTNLLELMPATPTILGGVKVGSGLRITNDGILSAEVQEPQDQINIEEGIGINVDTDGNTKRVSIDIGSGNLDKYLKVNLVGNGVEWASVSQGIEYTEGIGISIDDNEISINVDHAEEGLVLSYNGENIEWINVGEQYDEGDGIKIVTPTPGNKIIKGKIRECEETGYNSGFNASSSIEFGASSNASVIKNVITLIIDKDPSDSYELHPYTYTNIELASSGTIKFVIDGLTDYMQGDPVYVILLTNGTQSAYTIEIVDSHDAPLYDFISINNALVLEGQDIIFGNDNITKYLITMQFGIVKIEPLGYLNKNVSNP